MRGFKYTVLFLVLAFTSISRAECTNCHLGPVILPPYFLVVNFGTSGLVWGGGKLAGSEGGYWATVKYGVLPAILGGVLDGLLMFREDYKFPYLSLPLILAGNLYGNRKSHLERRHTHHNRWEPSEKWALDSDWYGLNHLHWD